MSDGPIENPSNGATRDGPGIALAKAREAAGITQREVSDALNLPITMVDAIESDDRQHLPADVFSRGYIRAYARLLELDPDPLVAAFRGTTENDEPLRVPSGPQTAGMNVQLQALLTPKALLVGAGILLVSAVLVVWLLSGDDTAQLPAETDTFESGASLDSEAALVPGAALESGATLDAGSPLQPGTPVQSPTAVMATADVPAQSLGSGSVGEADSAIAPPTATEPGALPQETQVLADTPVGVQRLTALGDDRLSIEFTEECWVEIKDPVGNMLYGNLGRPGNRLEFVGAAPFRVLLGYAPGALLKYNAEPVALGPHTRNNVASLVLGQ